MLLPVVLYFALFKYWPMYWMRMAFYDFKILRGFDSKFVGWKHFTRFFESTDFWTLTSNTLTINFSSLIFVFPVPILFALLLNEVSSRKFTLVPLFDTENYIEYGSEFTGKLTSIFAQCVVGEMTTEEFYAQYENIKADGWQDIIDEQIEAYAKMK